MGGKPLSLRESWRVAWPWFVLGGPFGAACILCWALFFLSGEWLLFGIFGPLVDYLHPGTDGLDTLAMVFVYFTYSTTILGYLFVIPSMIGLVRVRAAEGDRSRAQARMTGKHLLALISAAAIGLVCAVILAFLLRGAWPHPGTVFRPSYYALAALSLTCFLALALAKRWRPRVMNWVVTAILCVLIAVLLQFLSIPCGVMVRELDVGRAKEYCEALVPALDVHKRATGSYPEAVDEFLPAGRPVPRLLQDLAFYSCDGDSFHFRFQDGSTPGTMWVYNDEENSWHFWPSF